MATVRPGKPTKKGPTWRAVWFETKNGERLQRTKVFAKRSDAKAHAAKMATEVEQRGVGDPARHTVGRWFKRWIATLIDRGEKSPPTIAGYRDKLNLLAVYVGDIRLDKLSPADLDDAYAKLLAGGGKNGRKLAPSTVLQIHRVAHTCLERARKGKLIVENPARDADKPSAGKGKARAFTADELGKILAAAREIENDPRSYPGIVAVVTVLYASGMRRAELLGLASDAVDAAKGTITIRRSVVRDLDGRPMLRDDKLKTGESYRVVSLDPQTMALLAARKAWAAGQALKWGADYQRAPLLVFPGPGGVPYDPNAMTLRLRRVLDRAGVKGQPAHGHRHSMATVLIAAGIDIKTVSTRLGHASATTTLNLYAHAVEGRDRGAADVLAGALKSATKVQQEPAESPESA